VGKGRNGYTSKLDEAMLVEDSEARSICRNRPQEDSMWSAALIDSIASRQVDGQDLLAAITDTGTGEANG
jgi:hypothetical protein